MAFADLITIPTRAQIKAQLIGLAEAAGLTVTSWVLGDPSERWLEISARAIDQFLSNITTQAIRGFFLDLATDPGDPGDLSSDQTPRHGWLSALGSGWYGTTRGAATLPTGFVTITNTGSSPTSPIPPYGLTFQRNSAASDGGVPTYRNDVAPLIYAGLGGTLTLAAGASLVIPVIGEQLGVYGNASPSAISICVTQSYGALSVTNASPVLGQAREPPATYVARCRQAAAAASPNGAADAYRYAATTGADGNVLQLYDGSGATSVNRVYVSPSSATGLVTVYYANLSGPATAAEVSSANANITGVPVGVITSPIGVLPDTATIGPTATDAVTGGPGGAAAIATPITIAGTVRIKGVPGTAALALVAAAQAAIAAAESSYFSSPTTAPIGGLDQTLGAGVIYTADLQDLVASSYTGLYAPSLSAPAASTTTIAIGHVPTLAGPPSITAAANNGSGVVRLGLSPNSSQMTNGQQVQIYNAVTTGGLNLVGAANGIWTVTVVDGTHIDLQGSAWTGAFVGASLSLVAITVT